MNKIMQAGILVLSFSHMIQSVDVKESVSLKKLIEEIHTIIDTLDQAFTQILTYGNPEGYVIIDKAGGSFVIELTFPLNENFEVKKMVDELNKNLQSIVQFISERPSTKEKVLSYMMQFKNKIDLIDLITKNIAYLNALYQSYSQKGCKKEAAHIRTLVIFASDIRSKWVNQSPVKMLENLRNSLK